VLPRLTGYFSSDVYALNDAGVAIGRAYNGFDARAVRWDAAGAITELGHLGLDSDGITFALPRTLNSAGTAVGHAYKHDASGSYQGTVPVRWEASTTTAIELETPGPTPTGFRFGDARDINDSGVAVGNVIKSPAFPTDDFGTRAARWDAMGTAVTLLGPLNTAPNGEGFSDAFAINSSGLIVGTATRYDEAFGFSTLRAVYWREAVTPVDLNSLIDPASGWRLTHAYAASDTGWIAGDGYFDPDGPGGQTEYGRHFLLQLPAPLQGDFNNDGSVDAADYVVWRKTGGTQESYNLWRSHFGESDGSGSGGLTAEGLADSTAVPESSGAILLLTAATVGLVGHRKRSI
jgi:hypothetical protein